MTLVRNVVRRSRRLAKIVGVGMSPPRSNPSFSPIHCTATAKPDFPPEVCPINTHGGLLGYGAPWEVPAGDSIIEAYEQLTGRASKRQIPHARRALVYGNGGIFSASAVAILGRSV